ncbi:MAG: hypothetical protein AB7S50_02105 [Bacteroidales bacterium]
MNRKIILFLILIFLIGCGPFIYFKSPQPAKKSNLSSFPKDLFGSYLSLSDSSIIVIESQKIVKKRFENMIMSFDEYSKETGDTLFRDTTFLFTDNWLINMKTVGDSIDVKSSRVEEFFSISNKNILRKYKGYYFLNYEDTNNLWRVEILKLENDTLELGNILTKEDLEKIKSFTIFESYTDTTEPGKSTKYYLNPSKREVRKILKIRTPGEKFIKQ